MKLKSKSDEILQSPPSVSDEVLQSPQSVAEADQKKSRGFLLKLGLMGGLTFIFFLGMFAWHFVQATSCKVKVNEARQYVASMNKGQQAHFWENGEFGNSIEQLGIDIKSETKNYRYSMEVTPNLSIQSAVSKRKESRSYIGAVLASENGKTTSILCQSKEPGLIQLLPPRVENGVLTCSSDSELP